MDSHKRMYKQYELNNVNLTSYEQFLKFAKMKLTLRVSVYDASKITLSSTYGPMI
jgi:hypothetical protein